MAETFNKQTITVNDGDVQDYLERLRAYDQSVVDFKTSHTGNYYEDDSCIIMYSDSESVVNGVVTDISNTDAYKAKIKKQTIQVAKATRDKAINEITNAKLLDDLQLDAGTITQAIYDARKTARLAQLAEVQTAFYTTTGLTQPTTITA